ncbi:MlpL-like protein, lipoprotein (plasmid) [Borrelia duttonii Ly]|uniref:MlpL-like protein, lipoprotein n=2 Tax=Borrelia duttonii TaxID=40834 RepID=B5RNP1_BORDL|nr:MlpL-like protein, lipoprotein [Borrelia duttonii Ly]
MRRFYMKITNFTLILLLLMSSCDQENNTNKGIKSRNKRDLEQQVEAQKTPEEALREKLNDNQKKGLDFLKEALNSENMFTQLVLLNESNIKDALDHIQSELAKCTGDEAEQKKGTFKTVINGYFSTMNNETLKGIKENATSTCNQNDS